MVDQVLVQQDIINGNRLAATVQDQVKCPIVQMESPEENIDDASLDILIVLVAMLKGIEP